MLAIWGLGFSQTVSVGPNVPVRQNFLAQDETTIAISPTTPGLLLGGWNDYSMPAPNQVGGGYGISTDYGATWTHGYIPNPSTQNFDGNGDPAVAIGPDGRMYYTMIAFKYGVSYGKSGIYCYNSANGTTWSKAEVAFSALNDFHDKEYVTVDPANGNVYIAWTKMTVAGNTLLYAYSTNKGATWSAPKTVATGGVYPDLVVDNAGTLWISYMVFTNPTTGSVKVHRITSPGSISPNLTQFHVTTFSELGITGKVGGDGIRCTAIPSIDYHRPTGKFSLVWPTKLGTNLNAIMYATSSTGQTWGTPKRIDDGTVNDRYFPWVSYSTNGNICVVYYDNRNSETNRLLDVYAALSFDAGATWVNVRVTSAMSDPKFQFSGDFFGDYIGVAADEKNVFHAIWTDARPPGNEQDIWTAPIIVTPALKIAATLTQYVGPVNGYPLTLELWKGATLVYSQGITVDAGGLATINLPSGVYDFDKVSLRGHRFLRRTVPYSAGTTHSISLTNGDINDDNTVNVLDLNKVLTDFAKPGLPSDLNGNGLTDVSDLSIILVNFTMTGD